MEATVTAMALAMEAVDSGRTNLYHESWKVLARAALAAHREAKPVRVWLQREGQPQRELTSGFRVEDDGRVTVPLALNGEQAILTLAAHRDSEQRQEPTEAMVEAAARMTFRQNASLAHSWEMIADPG